MISWESLLEILGRNCCCRHRPSHDRVLFKDSFDFITEVVSDEEKLKKILHVQNFDEFINYLGSQLLYIPTNSVCDPYRIKAIACFLLSKNNNELNLSFVLDKLDFCVNCYPYWTHYIGNQQPLFTYVLVSLIFLSAKTLIPNNERSNSRFENTVTSLPFL